MALSFRPTEVNPRLASGEGLAREADDEPTHGSGQKRIPGHTFGLRLTSALVLAVAMALMTVQSASASTWTTWFNGTVKPNVWKYSAEPPQAKYNGARVTGAGSLTAVAYVYVPERGVASGSSSVTTTFPYQGGTFECKFNWGGSATDNSHSASLKCELRIQ